MSEDIALVQGDSTPVTHLGESSVSMTPNTQDLGSSNLVFEGENVIRVGDVHVHTKGPVFHAPVEYHQHHHISLHLSSTKTLQDNSMQNDKEKIVQDIANKYQQSMSNHKFASISDIYLHQVGSKENSYPDFEQKTNEAWNKFIQRWQNQKSSKHISNKTGDSEIWEDFYAAVWLFYFADASDFHLQKGLLFGEQTETLTAFIIGFCSKSVLTTMSDKFGGGVDVDQKMNIVTTLVSEHVQKSQCVPNCIGLANNQEFDMKLPEDFGKNREHCTGISVEYDLTDSRDILEGAEGVMIVTCRRRDDNKLLIAKSVHPKHYKHLEKEKEILESCEHYNAITYFGVFKEDKLIYLVMELCGGNVSQWVSGKRAKANGEKSDKRPLDPKTGNDLDVDCVDYFDISSEEIIRQSINGLNYLHDRKIVHRDIKPDNYLLKKMNNGKTAVKITDFGLSREIKPGASRHFTKPAGTDSFMAPECYCRKENEETVGIKLSSDIFSLGGYIYYVLTLGKYLFGEESYNQMSNIRSKDPPSFHHLLQKALDESELSGLEREKIITACDLVKKMVCYDPEKRPTIDEVAKHPTLWITKRKIEFFEAVADVLDARVIKLEAFNKYKRAYFEEKPSGTTELVQFDVTTDQLPTNKLLEEGERKSEVRGIQDFIRVLRNKYTHANKLSERQQKGLGLVPENLDVFLGLFLDPVPQLLIHCYDFFEVYKDKIKLSSYY